MTKYSYNPPSHSQSSQFIYQINANDAQIASNHVQIITVLLAHINLYYNARGQMKIFIILTITDMKVGTYV